MVEKLVWKGKKAAGQRMKRNDWPQIQATTLADRVYQIIRARILQRELAPGTFIREQEVSRATGVSRTPVREALNRLASQHFLERVPHRGFRVPESSWEVLVDVYPIIVSLGTLAASLALPQITAADLRKLRDLNSRLADNLAADDPHHCVDCNGAFHKVISDRCGNAKLAEMLDGLRDQLVLLEVWYFSLPENITLTVRNNESIIASLESSDLARLSESLRIAYLRNCQVLREERDRRVEIARH